MPRTWSSVILAFMIAISCSSPNSFAGQAERGPWRGDAGQNFRDSAITFGGEISAGGRNVAGWTVELLPPQGGMALSTDVRGDGSFEFGWISSGDYKLRLTDGRGSVVHEEFVSANGNGSWVSIRLPQGAPAQRGQSASVSVRELSRKVPRKAHTEFNRGIDDLRKSKFTAALAHFQAALAVDPEFADAHVNAGVAYFKLDQYAQSLEHFQKAVDLTPENRLANDNLCILLLKLRRYSDAGLAADRILKRGEGSPIAHFAAAVDLIVHGGSRSRALDHLRFAADTIPKARLLLAQTLSDSGRRDDAVRELETFLRSPDADSRRPELETWLAELKQ